MYVFGDCNFSVTSSTRADSEGGVAVSDSTVSNKTGRKDLLTGRGPMVELSATVSADVNFSSVYCFKSPISIQ